MRAAVYRRFGGPDTEPPSRSREVPRGLWLLAAFGIGAFRPRRRVLGMDVADVVEPSPPRSPASVRATRSSPCWARPDDFSIEAATYDVIVDCVGNASFERVAHLLNPGGALLLRAVRDRTYDLVDIPEAHRFVDTGRKRGNVVVRIAGDEFEPTPWDTDATKGSSS